MQVLTPTLRRSLTLCLSLALVGGACRRDTGADALAPSHHEALTQVSHLAAPELSATTINAGSPITVDCPSADGEAEAEAGRPALYPEAPLVEEAPGHRVFVPTRAGSYVTQCISDRDGSYSTGPTLEVLPSTAERLVVRVEQAAIKAGAAIDVACEGRDAYDNAVALPIATGLSEPAVAFVVGGHEVALDGNGQLPIDARLHGPVEVAAQARAWPWVPPSVAVAVDVAPTPLVSLTAEVAAMFYSAHEPVNVACMGIDAHGHKRLLDRAYVRVLEGDAVINGHSFYADKQGRYRVLCTTQQEESPDGTVQPALTSAPTEVTVAPGAPARWTVRWHASGACQSQSTPLPFTWRIYDAFGNRLEHYDVALETEPATPLTRNAAGGYTIAAAGEYSLTLSAVGPGAERLEPWHKETVINSTPPRIVVTSPRRAATVQSDDETVMLTGYVKSAFGPLQSVTMHDQVLDEASGRESIDFAVPYNSRWGLNIVQGKAQDVCGNEAVLVQSFLHSQAFAPPAVTDDDEGRAPHAVRVRLGQATWDDGDTTTPQDVASLMQEALKSSSLEDRLPHRLGAWPASTDLGELPSGRMGFTKPFAGKINGFEVFRDGPLAFEQPTIEYLHTNDGGWDVAFTLDALAVPFVVHQYFHWGLFGSGVLFKAPGRLTTARMRVEAHIGVAMADGEPKATVDAHNLHVTFAEGAPNLNLGLPGDTLLGGRLEKLVLSRFRELHGALVPLIEERVRTEMVAQLDIFLAGLELHHSMKLPPPFEKTLLVKSGLDTIDLHGPKGEGYGDFGLYTKVVSPKVSARAPRSAPFEVQEPVHGPIRRKPLPDMPLALHDAHSFALGVHDDLLNQMLWATWASGALNRPAAGSSGASTPSRNTGASAGRSLNLLDAAEIEIFTMSPPVVMPSENDNEVVLGIGDVWGRARLNLEESTGKTGMAGPPLEAAFFFSAVVRMGIAIDSEHGTLVLTPIGTPQISLEVNPVEPAVMTAGVRNWLMNKLRSSMPRQMSHMLSAFPLPELAIGRIPGVPTEAVWRLDHGTLERPAHGAEVMMQGTLRGGHADVAAP